MRSKYSSCEISWRRKSKPRPSDPLWTALLTAAGHRVDPDEIDDRCDALRKNLSAEQARSGGGPNTKNLKSHQVHELAKAKIEESEKLRKALGISKDYEEGSHWKRQEERKMDAEREKGRGSD